MPGTILVSVLEFMGLPLSSSTSLTVSMGKTVYQVSEKGDFSFPLTSLRNDLIVLLQDVDGNEILRTGIAAKSIVEKGVWEDIFPLGNGQLHLKLQFILNDKEREKIRIMRQSALKKKHDELLDSSPRSVESDTTSARSAALPLCTNDEVSDQNREMPSTASVSQAVNHTQLQYKGLIKKPAIHSPSLEDLQGAIGYPEKQNLLEKTPSNVRKMISAFESGLVQDTRSHIKPPSTNCQFSEIETNAYSTNWHSKDYEAQITEQAGFLKGRIRDFSHEGKLQQAPEYNREQFNLLSDVFYKEIRQLEELSTIKILNKQIDSIERNTFTVTQTDIEKEKYNKDLMNTIIFETFTVSGKMQVKYSGRNHPGELFRGVSPLKLDSVMHFEDKFYYESSGVWIFPDDQRRFCLQAGDKILMDLLETQVKRRISHQRSLDFSIIEVADKNATSFETGTGTEVSSHGEIHKIEESKSKNSDDNDDKISAGPINQVIKVAIIVGFGILVLLTRQRKSR